MPNISYAQDLTCYVALFQDKHFWRVIKQRDGQARGEALVLRDEREKAQSQLRQVQQQVRQLQQQSEAGLPSAK